MCGGGSLVPRTRHKATKQVNGGGVTHLSGCVVARMLPLKVSIFLPVAVTVRIQPQKCIKHLTNWIQLALRTNKQI